MTLVLKNSISGKSCTMEASGKHIEILRNFGATVDTTDSKNPVAYVSDPGFVMGHLKKIGS